MLEEQVYAQLYSLDAQKKLEREIAEAKEKQMLNADTLAVLDWQNSAKESKVLQQTQLTAIEREMLKTQWQAEAEREKKAEEERHILVRERNLGLISHNQ